MDKRQIRLLAKQLRYRLPMEVTDTICYRDSSHRIVDYCICPRCSAVLEREYQAYCVVCGQRLDWRWVVVDE